MDLLESVTSVLSLSRAPDALWMADLAAGSPALWGPNTWAELGLLISPLMLALQFVVKWAERLLSANETQLLLCLLPYGIPLQNVKGSFQQVILVLHVFQSGG